MVAHKVPTKHMKRVFCIAILMLQSFGLSAEPAVPMSGETRKAFTECLLARAKTGQYTSLDGGNSALRLIGACREEWEAYVTACEKAGGRREGEGNCTMQSALLAQTALKLLNK